MCTQVLEYIDSVMYHLFKDAKPLEYYIIRNYLIKSINTNCTLTDCLPKCLNGTNTSDGLEVKLIRKIHFKNRLIQ